MAKKINVTIWNEFRHEKSNEYVKSIYPDGLHACIAEQIKCDDFEITLASLDEPECGLPDEILNNTDVLIWWGHMAHWDVPDELVAKVRRRVYMGMGLIALHSAHYSKVFDTVVGTTGNLTWGAEMPEIVWNINPTHPIAKGIPTHFKIAEEEVYAEPFQIPEPDEIVFLGWYEKGYVFRSGCTWRRGFGKVFYFQPGHESVPTFKNPYVIQVIKNAVYWAKPALDDMGYKAIDSSPCLQDWFAGDEDIEEFKK